MKIQISAMQEALCTQWLGDMPDGFELEQCRPDVWMLADKDAQDTVRIWLYQSPWQVLLQSSRLDAAIEEWCVCQRQVLRLRQQAGQRLVLVNADCMNPAQVLACLNLGNGAEMGIGKDASLSAHALILAHALQTTHSAIWDVFEALESVACLPNGWQPTYRHALPALSGKTLQQWIDDMQKADGEIARTQAHLAEHMQHAQALQVRLGAQEHEIQTLQQQKTELESSLKTRFQELAILTGMLEKRDAVQQANEATIKQQANLLAQQEQKIKAQLDEIDEAENKYRELNKQTPEVQALKNDLAKLQSENIQLKNEVQEFTRELIQRDEALTQAPVRIESLEQQLTQSGLLQTRLAAEQQAMQARLAAQDSALKKEQQASQSALALQAAHATLQKENEQLRQELAVQGGRMNDRFKELAALTRMIEERDLALEEKDRQIQQEKRRVVQLKNSLSWKLTAPVRALARPPRKKPKTAEKAQQMLLLVEQSGLFDTAWYLLQYPDVAQSGMNPIEHYLNHGAAEGRNPNASFDTHAYLSQYPDVREAGLNPFVHYIQFGRNEGRTVNTRGNV